MFNFLKNLRGELAHVIWPTSRQVAWFTFIVVGASIIVAYYLGALDILFTRILSQFI